MEHVPVLTKEVLEALAPKANENFIDCTLGQGGHTKLILEKIAPNGRVLGIDLDPQVAEFSKRLVLVNDSYANLKNIVEENNFSPVSGILLDLGFSSKQLEESGKGFSFQKDEPLDMRYGNNDLTAEIIVNEYSEQEIEKILTEFGEENFARKITKNIVEQRIKKRIKSTFELLEVIKSAVPASYLRDRIHYATRTFQALRIAVNNELENIEKVLPSAVSILEKGGRLAVISFHSLEDRIVKNFLKEQKNMNILTKKPITAGDEEVKENPRSRSAKLRVAIKI